jgi:MFS family permease
MLALFKNPNFLFLFLGRLVTNAGDSLYYVAAMWLVFELGGSAFYTGLAGFLTLLPQSLQFLSGPFVDRWSLKKTLVVSQLLQCILILVIPITHYMGILNVTLVLIIMPIIALIGQIAYPVQSATLPRILAKKDLVKGNSAFSFAYQGIDLTFNALAGILVSLVGAISLYVIDSVTFIIAVLLFLSLKIPERERQEEVSDEQKSIKKAVHRYVNEIKEGFAFIKGTLLWKIILGSVFANFAMGATIATLPALGETLGGPELYGYYLAALSAGSLLGALSAAWLGKFPLGKLAIVSFVFSSLFWMLSAIIPWVPLSLAFFGMAWIPIGGTNVIFSSMLQSIIPEHMMGRIFSALMSINTVAMPIGSLIGGTMTDLVGSVIVFGSTGFALLFVPIYWAVNSILRNLPIVEEIGDRHLYMTDEEETKEASTPV